MFVVAPLAAVLWRLPWSDVGDIVGDPDVLGVLWLSVRTSLIAAGICAVTGVPTAWWLSRTESTVATVARTLVMVPMVLPPVVGGIALLAAFGRRGLLGGPLHDWFGLSLPFTQTALVMAQAFVALPFFVVAAESAFRQIDRQHEEMAATLGAGAGRTMWRVLLPALWPSMLAGALLAWARALGEFGATITFAGSFPGRTQTLPMLVYSELETDWGRSLVLGALMIVTAGAILGVLRSRWIGSGPR